MLKTIGIIAVILFVIFMIFLTICLCITAGRAEDDVEDEYYAEKEKNDTKSQ